MKTKRFCRTIFTNGKGNNIFQFFFGEILSECQSMKHLHDELDLLSVAATVRYIDKLRRFPLKIGKKEADFMQYLQRRIDSNVLSHCYPEDYRIYLPHRKKFLLKYPKPSDCIENDLGVHLRLGDRLLMSDVIKFTNQINLDEFCRAIDTFKCSSVTIYTDMPVWREIDAGDLIKMKFHTTVKSDQAIDYQKAANYFNSVVKTLSAYDPVVRLGKPVVEDFRQMRRHKNFLFQHGTLAWWACFLGNAERVGVQRYWRNQPQRFPESLAQVPLPGWFGWG
jgi:hypothetical protein